MFLRGIRLLWPRAGMIAAFKAPSLPRRAHRHARRAYEPRQQSPSQQGMDIGHPIIVAEQRPTRLTRAARRPGRRGRTDGARVLGPQRVIHATALAGHLKIDRPGPMSCVEVEAADRVGDAGGTIAALDLDGYTDDDLHPAGDVGRLEHVRTTADARADLDRGRKPHLVRAVVDAHLRAYNADEVRQEEIHERQGQVTMRYRRAKRTARGARRVDVDPLMIVRHMGERVDT